MMFIDLKKKLDEIINELSENNILTLKNIESEDFLKIVNKYNFLIMLADVDIYRPICINNFSKDFFGFQNNRLKEEEYFYFLKVIHTDTYASFLEILQFYKKDISDCLNIDYKLLNKNNEWKILNGVTKVLLRQNGNPKYSITIAYFDDNKDSSFINKFSILTNREREITNYLSSGLSKKEVANKLNISQHTTHTHTKNIYKKLNINKVSELVSLNEKYSI